VHKKSNRHSPLPWITGSLLAAALIACSQIEPSNGGASGGATSPSGATGGTVSIAGVPTTAVQAGSAYRFQPAASAPAGRVLTFSIANPPDWASFDTGSGALTGTPSRAAIGLYADIRISASDGTQGASLSAFSITVTSAPNGTATLTWVPPTMNTNGSPLTDLAGYTIRYGNDAGALSQTLTLSDPAATSTVVAGLGAGTWFFAVEAYDSLGHTSAPSNMGSKSF
jgi:hypothetical protein